MGKGGFYLERSPYNWTLAISGPVILENALYDRKLKEEANYHTEAFSWITFRQK